jgi:hypothetical protein
LPWFARDRADALAIVANPRSILCPLHLFGYEGR